MSATVAGTEPGQRQRNGPQTSGRDYRNLSQPDQVMVSDLDVAVPMRDGIVLLADVHRPEAQGRYPVLIAASPYPRQIQNLGAPMGFVEAGASDFFVPRGYVHVIANYRGTSGSGGTFGFFDGQERQDMYDLVEWAARQSWSDGNVGMIGISYFAMTQLEAAVEQPPHLKAIFPVAATVDLYESASHHGLVSSSFVTPFLSMVGMTSGHTNRLWRSRLVQAVGTLLHEPHLQRRFATINGEAAMTGLKMLLKLHHDPHPWDDLWRAVNVEHPTRDAWWDERNLLPLLERIEVPVYLGCDWQNAPLQLKDRDTGILDGAPIRYVVPGRAGWRTADSWPLPDTVRRAWTLRADGVLAEAGNGVNSVGARAYLTLGAGLDRPQASATDPASSFVWTTDPLPTDVVMVGDIELVLDAVSTATDTAWLVTLQDVDPSGAATDVTMGGLRASLRQVDEDASRPGAPALPCRTPQLVPLGELVRYRIPLAASARSFPAGHRIQLSLSSDDQDPEVPAMMGFRHASVGSSSLNTVYSSSRLSLPTAGKQQESSPS